MDMMSTINNTLVSAMGPLGPLIAVGGLGLFLVLLTLPMMMKRPTDPMEKLQRSLKLEAEAKKAPKGQELRPGGKSDKLQKFAAFLEPQDEGEMGEAKLEMLRAGYRAKNAVRTYHAAQFVFGISLLIVGVIYAMIKNTQAPLTMQSMLLYTLLPGAVGYYLPRHYVKKRVATRQQEIVEGFPDALDMMLVCVEAGQSLDQSILRVAKELNAGYPALAEEFELVSHEVKAGKQRVAVLKDMAERCGVPDVASFVTVLVQSATFGTSIADALRVYASEMRDKRVMRAEEKANTIPTKLTLGTMLFTVPPLMIILIGPAIQGIATTLSSAHF
ncbi:bacterial type II secretion system protein F domain protein [mine drainage metagenome]|uniref:Bacterial type II secretion system protein F domain protein n=1 Tax=mine drainage metagenome TaxID=410659 RepID=A0A1J5Q0N8_9ZZZZ